MLDWLVNSRILLASSVLLLSVGQYVISLWCVREVGRQSLVQRDYEQMAGKSQYKAYFTGTAASILVIMVLDRWSREILGGGLFVLQLAGFASNCGDVLSLRSLRNPNTAEGHVKYSARYAYESGGARLIGISIITASVGILFWSKPFLAGTSFILATAAGWYRRARQVSPAPAAT